VIDAEKIAERFHESYERHAPLVGYETREESRTDWENVPLENRTLMIAVAADLLKQGIIAPGSALE
jgi:hypothetical protein